MRTPSVMLLVAMAACGGGEPADVAGEYTVAVTNRENDCELDNWTEGESSQNIPLTVTQDGDSLSATIGGFAGAYLDLALGSNDLEGTVTGSTMTLELFGTNSQTEGNCTYTINATAIATLEGDALSGTIDYTRATNGNPDCEPLEGCTSSQGLSGARPPPE